MSVDEIRKHGILCRVSENGQQNTMLVRGKISPKAPK